MATAWLVSSRGEYDNELEWPFEGDIRVELLNWRADKNHHSDTISSQQIRCSDYKECEWVGELRDTLLDHFDPAK